ncbi:MAG: hypothetical protein RBS80_03690 [Thermoguttaceae bacterium]|nr:hypothetical protein [Thermoguttaceae bacterium]
MTRRCVVLVAAALVVPALAPAARADLWPILAAHYRLDETDTGSNVVYDSVGSVHGTRVIRDGYSVGIGAPGQVGTAYSFPGITGTWGASNQGVLV